MDRHRHQAATVTFTNETASGWQQATFASPIAVTANTTYVASYFTPTRYAVSSAYFASAATTRGPLTALRNGTDGGNGVYRYTAHRRGVPHQHATTARTTGSTSSSRTGEDTTEPTVTEADPARGATGVGVGSAVTAVFSEPVQQSTIAFELRGPGGVVVPAITSYNPATRTATLTRAGLAASTTYTATLSGARDTAGNTMAADTWTFTTERGHHSAHGQRPVPRGRRHQGLDVGGRAATFSEPCRQRRSPRAAPPQQGPRPATPT